MFQMKIFSFAFYIKLTGLFLLALFNFNCGKSQSDKIAENEKLKDFPPVILWAWERPENLQFIDSKKIGVAFLAQTLILQNDEVIFEPRRQNLNVSDKTFLIAVTRIETSKKPSQTPTLSDAQRNEIIDYIKKTIKLPRLRAIQIDFDAITSERNFYRDLLNELRPQLPKDFSLTITALASWCASDNWLKDLPVDEAVPMAFEMGADNKQIRDFLSSGNDWNEPLCRGSYGIALDEPLKTDFKPNRRFYVFNNRAWQADDLKYLPDGVMQ